MGYPIHPLSNVGVAGQYLNQLSSDNISQRYFSGQETYNGGFLNRLKILFNINGTLKQLKNFYPYVPIVKVSQQSYNTEISNAVQNGLVCTAVSWLTIFSLARRGKVLPFFSQYGKYFKTHRLFRQYIFSLIAPTALFTSLVDFKYLNNTQHLWAVHARRMNSQLTSDPENSEYPEELLPTSWIGSWMTPYRDPFDRKKKIENQVHILIAPDYEEPTYEIQEIEVEEEEQDEESDE